MENLKVTSLEKENEYLRDQFYGQRVQRRQAIIQDLIRCGHDADSAIASAEKLCSFIESRQPAAVDYVAKKLGKRLVKAAKEGRAAVKSKRKYTKRSKFWKKNG